MRVLFVSHSSGAHGAERSLLEVARALSAQSVEVRVALPAEGPLAEKLAAAGVPVIVGGHRWLWWVTSASLTPSQRLRSGVGVVRRSRKPLEDLRAIVRDMRPDVVVTNTITFPHAAIAATLERVPHVWHIREFGKEDLGLTHFFGDAPCVKAMAAMSSRLVTCSGAVATKVRRYVDPDKIRVVYNAVDAPELPVRRDRVNGRARLLVLGRLHAGKGQEDAVRATAILADRGLDVELSLVGTGPDDYRRRLVRLAERSGACDRVSFHDFTATPISQLARCDMLLMTSRSEAFGRVTVEAMRAGRPVVAAGAGGTLELVDDERNGLLYPVGDVAALARQIERLLADDSLRTRIASCGQEWARRTFSIERNGAELLEVLSEAAGRSPT